MTKQATPESETEQPFVAHLLELRDRLLRVVISVLVIFLSLFYFANDLYTLLAGPLTKHLPEGSSMIAIEVASPFLTPFKLTLVLSIFLAMPIILHQMWKFVAPGLYHHERRLAMPIVASSVVLFYTGMTFAYFVVFPLVFGFFTSVSPEGVTVMTDISKYLDFVLTIFFAFGIAFEVPIATVVLVWTGATTPKKLGKMRPYVIVGAFVIGMLLTPPDIISQTLLAIPMWILFELGILFSRFYAPKADEEDEEEEEGVAEQPTEPEPEPSPTPTAQTASIDAIADEPPWQEHDYTPLTEQEMDEELDRIDQEMGQLDAEDWEPEDEDKATEDWEPEDEDTTEKPTKSDPPKGS